MCRFLRLFFQCGHNITTGNLVCCKRPIDCLQNPDLQRGPGPLEGVDEVEGVVLSLRLLTTISADCHETSVKETRPERHTRGGSIMDYARGSDEYVEMDGLEMNGRAELEGTGVISMSKRAVAQENENNDLVLKWMAGRSAAGLAPVLPSCSECADELLKSFGETNEDYAQGQVAFPTTPEDGNFKHHLLKTNKPHPFDKPTDDVNATRSGNTPSTTTTRTREESIAKKAELILDKLPRPGHCRHRKDEERRRMMRGRLGPICASGSCEGRAVRESWERGAEFCTAHKDLRGKEYVVW